MATNLTIQHADKNDEYLKVQTTSGEFVILPGEALNFTLECASEDYAILIEAHPVSELADAVSQELQETLNIDAALSDELLDKADAVSMETDNDSIEAIDVFTGEKFILVDDIKEDPNPNPTEKPSE